MTSDKLTKVPAWRDAWHLDDTEWVKARKHGWKDIKSSPYLSSIGLDEDEWTKVKNFYLTGSAFDPEPPEDKWQWHSYHPDKCPLPVVDSLLLELWLTAADSEDNFRDIYAKHPDASKIAARTKFRSVLLRLYPEHGNIFSGRDARIYRLLEPTRCRREDYPGEDESSYLESASYANSALGVVIDGHLSSEDADPENIAPVLVREWSDTVPGAYLRARQKSEETGKKFLQTYLTWHEKILSRSREIVNSPDKYDPSQVQCATDIIAYLSEMELPEELDTKLTPFLDTK